MIDNSVVKWLIWVFGIGVVLGDCLSWEAGVIWAASWLFLAALVLLIGMALLTAMRFLDPFNAKRISDAICETETEGD